MHLKIGDIICVTGGNGFLGQSLVCALRNAGHRFIATPSSAKYDLTRVEDARTLMARIQPDVVFHLAAVVGGIGANQERPGEFFYKNAMMGLNTMHAAWCCDVKRFVTVGTVCSYPKHTPVPFSEADFWNGYPEETNAPYGLAKKMLLAMQQAYSRQYGFDAIHVVLANLFGPGDNFDPRSSHVIPAMIVKFIDAVECKRDEVILWGDGSPTREFLYVDDAATALIAAAGRYCNYELPLNVGTGIEVSMKQLADEIAALTGFYGTITWDATRPNGQPRRCLNVQRAREFMDIDAFTPRSTGLEHTINWYRTHRLTR